MAKAKKAEATEEIVDLKKAAKKQKKEAKKEALKLVLSYVRENADGDQFVIAVALLTPGNRGGGSQVSSSKMAIIEKIRTEKTFTEDEIWNEFKLGRAEMRKISVNLIKKVSKPEERMWVAFDPEEGVYSLVATGAEVPEGWTGYRPVDTEDIDL